MKSATVAGSATIGKNCYVGHIVVIEDDAIIGNNSIIEAGSIVGRGVNLGRNARIESNVSINYSIIGDDVVILSGARIGQDRFGFSTENGVHHKILHIGIVKIGNNVEIGANTTIDRGSLQDTVIEGLCRIDNLVQIGHSVRIGKGSISVAQAGIAGSSVLGKYCALGGQVGIAEHLNIGDDVQVAAQGGVAQNIDAGKIVGGSSAMPIMDWHRQSIIMKQLLKKRSKYMTIDIVEIMELIPQRYQFLLVDKVIEIDLNKSITGIKNVTVNEPQFTGHFPARPVMQGVLIIEAIAQLAAILVAKSLGSTKNKEVFLMAIEDTKFRKIVQPGDTMHIHATIDRQRANVWKFSSTITIEGEIAAESKFTAMIKDKA